jgi:hypothetical protein
MKYTLSATPSLCPFLYSALALHVVLSVSNFFGFVTMYCQDAGTAALPVRSITFNSLFELTQDRETSPMRSFRADEVFVKWCVEMYMLQGCVLP